MGMPRPGGVEAPSAWRTMVILCGASLSSLPISSGSGSRPNFCVSAEVARFQRVSNSTMYAGTRTDLALLISARRMVCLIHQEA